MTSLKNKLKMRVKNVNTFNSCCLTFYFYYYLFKDKFCSLEISLDASFPAITPRAELVTQYSD